MEGTDIILDSAGASFFDGQLNLVLLCNLAIAIAIFTSIRWLSGVVSHTNPNKELLKKDNPAFGISLSAVVLAVTIVLTGAIYGDPIYALEDSVISVGLYGIIGLVLLTVARIIFEKVALPDISIRDEIIKGNISAAIADAGNVIAAAIIIRAMMVWVDANTIEGIAVVLIGFSISQAILTATTILRTRKFAKKLGKTYQEHFTEGNTSAALRFAGRKIGTAFAITAAANVLLFEEIDIKMLVLYWSLLSVIMILALSILAFIANKIILFHVDTDGEVIRQHNIAIGIIQCVIYISLGMLLSELLA